MGLGEALVGASNKREIVQERTKNAFTVWNPSCLILIHWLLLYFKQM